MFYSFGLVSPKQENTTNSGAFGVQNASKRKRKQQEKDGKSKKKEFKF